MTVVRGFEGNVGGALPVSWGAAVLQQAGKLINSASGHVSSIADLDELTSQGFASPTPDMALPAGVPTMGLQVVAIDTTAKYGELLRVDTGKAGGLVAHAQNKGHHYYVFDSDRSRRRYCHHRIDALLKRLLYAEPEVPTTDREFLLDVGLALDPSHPAVHAVRCHYADGDYAVQIARAAVEPDSEREFESLLDALTTVGDEYAISYEGGVAAGGGLDVDVASRTLHNLRTLHEQSASKLVTHFSFLETKVPAPRFREMKAASAILVFRADIEERTLGEKLSRVLELRLLESLLRGQQPEWLPRTEQLFAAVLAVTHPSPETKVRHRRGNAEYEQVQLPSGDADDIDVEVEEIAVFGVQTGIMNHASQIEATIFPARVLTVSATDDGEGEVPSGARLLPRTDDVLFRPTTFTVERRVNAKRRERFFLKGLEWLSTGESEVVRAIPSSIVKGAFLVDVEIVVERPDQERLKVGEDYYDGLQHRQLEASKKLVLWWSEQCKRLELTFAQKNQGRWLPPAKLPRITALNRVLVALHRLGGEAHQSLVVAKVNEIFDVNVRINNTRREVLRNPEKIEFDEGDEPVLRLTSIGRAYAHVWSALGILPE